MTILHGQTKKRHRHIATRHTAETRGIHHHFTDRTGRIRHHLPRPTEQAEPDGVHQGVLPRRALPTQCAGQHHQHQQSQADPSFDAESIGLHTSVPPLLVSVYQSNDSRYLYTYSIPFIGKQRKRISVFFAVFLTKKKPFGFMRGSYGPPAPCGGSYSGAGPCPPRRRACPEAPAPSAPRR